ncbi:NAD(P)H-binding protein [Methylobacter sp.]|uniref:NAD(P)H-binding protein n=1 Tax=Methylobacter sp. TaxID=2051955 RepID=UPI001217612E|nr:NAD(P)H-binding protein [Methylobacter sp.]TAK61512.1 MAG: SDR family NAD(P)-dependent oxidoreductase [Methylobacter sp.]
MNILLTGATGFIGQHLLRALLAGNHQVTVCCRQPEQLLSQFPSIKAVALDLATATNSDDWLPHLQHIDAVINAAGIIKETRQASFDQLHHLAPAALFKACTQMQVKKVVQISALGAELNATTEYFTSKAKADALLQSLDLDWFIFKPSLVFGSGAKSMGLLTALAGLPITPIMDDGQQALQPVAIKDLQQAVLLALKPQTPARQIINAVGPKPIPFISLMNLLANHLGRKLIPFHISGTWLAAISPLAVCVDEPILNKQSITMLQHGNTADAKGFTDYLGHSPNSLEQTLQESPASQAERWHARLYFLRPLLNISIALVWLWAGLVSAFLYPVADSYQMLSRVGITGAWAPLTLYGASLADFLLGILVLIRWRVRLVAMLQISIMLAYSVVISFCLPEFWLHPFGPLIKNLPLLPAILVLLIIEEERP